MSEKSFLTFELGNSSVKGNGLKFIAVVFIFEGQHKRFSTQGALIVPDKSPRMCLPILGLLGVSLGAMQVGGGIIVLLLAIAMVLGKESTFKGAPSVTTENGIQKAAIVPLAVPLLAGPAAFSYVMGNSAWHTYADLIHVMAPILIMGVACWIIFHIACQAEKKIRQSTLDVVERVGGFILAAMAIEMVATGLRGLFPMLSSV